jgi:diguanylate cyclase (GGDEF)-like protein/PAS domain S-box-containing protein
MWWGEMRRVARPPGRLGSSRLARAVLTRPWIAYPAVVVVVAVLYLAGPLNAGPVFNLLGASSAVAVALGARRHRPRGQLAWYLIALGQVLFVVGDVLAYNYERLFGGELPFPSIADPFYLAIYPCLTLGLLGLLRLRHPTRDRAGLIDALVVAVGFGALSWAYLMAPYAHDDSLTVLTKLTSLAYPVMDLLVLGVAARLVMGPGRRGLSSHLFAAALIALLGTDTLYGWELLHGGYETGGLLDGGWIAFYALIGTAALHPSMRCLSQQASAAEAGLTRRRLALFAATSLLAPGVQLVRSVLDQPREPVISVAAGVLFLLVLARLTILVRVQEDLTETTLRRRFEARLAALVRHASDFVSILGADARVSYASPSAEQLLGRTPEELIGRDWAEFVHPDDAAHVRAFLSELERGRSGSIDFRLGHPDGTWRDVETLATNLLGDGTVDGVVLNTRDVSQRKALERRLEHQAFHDALTGLPNRALFQDRVRQALTRSRRYGARVAVVFLDLDDFKSVNDSLGHAVGDAVLTEVAGRLQACVRQVDSAARLGGDEFALLLNEVAGELEAVGVAERVLESLARPVVLDGREFLITPSIGIAFDSDGTETAEELLRNADLAMYLAKDAGKGRFAIFEPAMHLAAVGQLQLKADLNRAIQDDRLSLDYQPIMDLESGEIVAVEALARWMHDEHGPVAPSEFIPLAERTGLIVPLGRALLRQACLQAAQLQAICPREPALGMCVNVSARQLQSEQIVADVRSALDESEIPPSSLVLELTESAMMKDVEFAIRRLHELRDLGVLLAIDDFGTGHSSLNSIRRFPIDILKIDRSFIQGIADGPAATQALTAAIIDLAHTLGLKPVAEGIEDAAQLNRLRELACTLGQGFHLERPLSASQITALARAQHQHVPQGR